MANTSDNSNINNPLKAPTLKGVLNYGVVSVKSDKYLEDLQDVDIDKEEREDKDIIYFDIGSQCWKRSNFTTYFNSL